MKPSLNPIHPLQTNAGGSNISEVRPYTTKDLCNIYQVSDKTFYKWILPFRDQIGTKRGRYFTIRQVSIIFSNLGLPYTINHDQIKLTA